MHAKNTYKPQDELKIEMKGVLDLHHVDSCNIKGTHITINIAGGPVKSSTGDVTGVDERSQLQLAAQDETSAKEWARAFVRVSACGVTFEPV